MKKMIHPELTCRDLETGSDNLWSILYTTGYLTKRGTDDGDMTELIIPNKEIRWIFEEQIQEWFEAETKKDSLMLKSFYRVNSQFLPIRRSGNGYS